MGTSEADKTDKAPSKPPSAAPSQKPASRASQKKQSSKPPSPEPERAQSKAPSNVSKKSHRKQPSPEPERPPSKAPSAVSKAPSNASKKSRSKTRQSQRSEKNTPSSLQTANHPFPRKEPPPRSNSKQSIKSIIKSYPSGPPTEVPASPTRTERTADDNLSLDLEDHPSHRDRDNTHLGTHRSPTKYSMKSRSRSVPNVKEAKEKTVTFEGFSPLAAGTPRPGTNTPRGSIRLDPLGSQISLNTINTLAKAPSIWSEGSIHIPDPLEEPGKLVSTQRFLDGVDAELEGPQPDGLPRERYFTSASSRKSKISLKPLPDIVEVKEPRHPRNIYIQKKLKELEDITNKLRSGPFDPGDWGLSPRKPDIEIMGPYSLDEIKYDEDDPPVRIAVTPENPKDIIDVIKKRFQLPAAWDPETGQIKEEIAKAAAIMSSATADPRESRQNPDPIGPSVCDCCEDMNDHNRHLADLERKDPRPRVVQAKKLEQHFGRLGVDATGYYRSDSPTLIPVSTYMDRDLASEEMVKIGVAETLVNKLKNVAKPGSLNVNQVPWPFYANEMATTNDLNAYLETGLPMSTDALLTVNVGQANSRYKDSMDRLERMMRKF